MTEACWDIDAKWCASRANGHRRCDPGRCDVRDGTHSLKCGCVLEALDRDDWPAPLDVPVWRLVSTCKAHRDSGPGPRGGGGGRA